MTTTISIEQEKNRKIAQRINRETRANPGSPYSGKYVGVWHEEVVVIGETLDEVCNALNAMGDHDDQAVAIEASADYDAKVMFWSCV